MADDGLILNFAIPSGSLRPKVILRGGPWQERRRVGKRLKTGNSGVEKSSKTSDNPNRVPIPFQRPSKRIKITDQNSSTSRLHSSTTNADRPVVSSLFTKNPTSQTNFQNAKEVLDSEPVKPSNAPLTAEQLTFASLGLSPKIAIHLTTKLSITSPTAIQNAAIPIFLKNETDLFIQAQTGSGKTLAYVLPLLHHILSLDTTQRDAGLFAIILAPTRELCKQIWLVLDSTLRFTTSIVAGQVMGGEKKQKEKARLRKGMNILVATPGRLADHIQHTKALDFSSVRWLVLDEGDRLMELGFEEDIKKITSLLDFRLKNPKGDVVKTLPTKRINILCSATLRGDVEKLGEISLKDAQHITSGNDMQTENNSKSYTVPAQLKQQYVITPAKLRLVTLYAMLKKIYSRCKSDTKVITFFSCADSVDFHFRIFSKLELNKNEAENEADAEKGNSNDPIPTGLDIIGTGDLPTSQESKSLTTSSMVTIFRLHGSLTQQDRTKTLTAFSKCTSPALLLSTDIASRGLDLPHVDRVIEFDAAFSKEEHLHRVGRTARAGKDGYASIFLLPGCEEGYVEVLKAERDAGEIGLNLKGINADQILRSIGTDTSVINKNNPEKTKPRFLEEEMTSWEQRATEFQLGIERWTLAAPLVLESARKAFQSHIRAYATHVKEERQWFDIKQLHFGHLAKAFGLRDRPSNVNVPGMRASVGKIKSDRRKAGSGHNRHDEPHTDAMLDTSMTRSKMLKLGKMKASADEFNLA